MRYARLDIVPSVPYRVDMSSQTLEMPPPPQELIDLRQQAHYWQAMHERAVEREQYQYITRC